MDIVKVLKENGDREYGDFVSALMPGTDRSSVIGVRTPVLRSIALQIFREGGYEGFLSGLPHRYFEEDQLHSFIISLEKDYDRCIGFVNGFLPYVENWAVCDQLSPKVFARNTDKLIGQIMSWIKSDHTYTVRFAVGMMNRHYLDEHFDPEYPGIVSEIRSDEYYINMMIAWYFATALAKQWDMTVGYIENRSLPVWVHNKAIQKALESRRVPDERKEYLRGLKIKEKR